MVKKMKVREVLRLIVELTEPSMTRMEAWKAVSAEVPEMTWESFKRLRPLAEQMGLMTPQKNLLSGFLL